MFVLVLIKCCALIKCCWVAKYYLRGCQILEKLFYEKGAGFFFMLKSILVYSHLALTIANDIKSGQKWHKNSYFATFTKVKLIS